MSSLAFRAFARLFRAIFGTRFARAMWHVPGSRWAYRNLMSRLRPETVVVDGHTIRLDPLDSLLLSVNGGYERYELQLFRRCISPGDVVLDVGAHIGLYTLEAARATGPSGQVHAFEPSSTNHGVLVENVAANGYSNVVVHRAAVSDAAGEGRLSLSPDNTGDHSLVRAGGEGETVTTLTVDALVAGRVDVIKMDIQGGEPAALRGARRTLDANQVVLFAEVSPDHLREQGGVRALLDLLEGFRVHLVDPVFGLREAASQDIVAALARSDGHVDIVCAKGPAALAKVRALATPAA